MKKNIWLLLMLMTALVMACKKQDAADIEKPELYAPTAFTPNGDGNSDTFKVKGTNISSFRMDIYNTDNVIVFHSDDINQGWDGNYNSKPVPAGTYTWIANYRSFSDKSYKETGLIELIR